MTSSHLPPPSLLLPQSEQIQLINKLDIFKIQGSDKKGRPILRIVGKFFPARIVSVEAVKKYLEDEIFPQLEGRRFAAVYVHTGVSKSDNFSGITALRTLYDAVPAEVWENLETLYFLHPSIQSRLFLATFGRLFFGGGSLYGKVKYVNRLAFLWDHVRRKGAEMPEFVYDLDEEMEERPATVDYGLESDHPGGCVVRSDSTVCTYSMRCIA